MACLTGGLEQKSFADPRPTMRARCERKASRAGLSPAGEAGRCPELPALAGSTGMSGGNRARELAAIKGNRVWVGAFVTVEHASGVQRELTFF